MLRGAAWAFGSVLTCLLGTLQRQMFSLWCYWPLASVCLRGHCMLLLYTSILGSESWDKTHSWRGLILLGDSYILFGLQKPREVGVWWAGVEWPWCLLWCTPLQRLSCVQLNTGALTSILFCRPVLPSAPWHGISLYLSETHHRAGVIQGNWEPPCST